jgi:hypothetical protein
MENKTNLEDQYTTTLCKTGDGDWVRRKTNLEYWDNDSSWNTFPVRCPDENNVLESSYTYKLYYQ